MSEDDCVLRIERLIAAPPERVFELWTEPELIAQWFGPDGYDIPSHALDVRPGGKWRTTMRSPEGTLHSVSGVYRVIDRPRRLVFTWAWDQDDGSHGHETEVTVTFEASNSHFGMMGLLGSALDLMLPGEAADDQGGMGGGFAKARVWRRSCHEGKTR